MGKTIVITGASDGIGAAAARQLARDGHEVVIVGRSAQKTEAVARELASAFFVADFARFDDVRALAASLDAAYPRIDVLANNAGGVFADRAKTVNGFEQIMQINHLSPFLLTNLLLDKLVASRASVIQTSSDAARIMGRLELADLDGTAGAGGTRPKSPVRAYGDAKLANILFTTELQARFHERGVSAASFHPGTVATSFASDGPGAMQFLYKNPLTKRLLNSPEKGARQLVWLASGTPGAGWRSGEYYEKGKPARTSPQAKDAELARMLWDRSAQLVGLG
jgi:NAD(P)-dependent dehydrogenase (short-subunit alcohol dehydrogenase family)